MLKAFGNVIIVALYSLAYIGDAMIGVRLSRDVMRANSLPTSSFATIIEMEDRHIGDMILRNKDRATAER